MAFKSSFIIQAKVFHKRLLPRINQFSYGVFYVCHELTRLENLSKKNFCRLYSLNHFNLFSFYERDYGAKDDSNLEVWIRKILCFEGLNEMIKKIFLLSHPRIFGYVFNPVSFWFCLDSDDRLLAVLAQVNNTFGETHNYLIFNQNHSPIEENQWLEAKKEFHVSPFFKVEGGYKFRFHFSEKKIAVWIDYYAQEKQLITGLISQKMMPISNLNFLSNLAKFPFMAFKVVFLIHWQALKIIAKKIRYVPKPVQKQPNYTKSNNP